MMELKIGITLPTIGEAVTLGNVGGVGAIARHVEDLEDLGLDSVWVPDLIVGDGHAFAGREAGDV